MKKDVRKSRRGGKPGGNGDSGGGNTTGPIDPITGRGGIPADTDSRAARLAVLQGVTVQGAEERARSFASGGRRKITTEALNRSLTLTSGNIVQPTRVSGINAGQNIVSGIVDMVRVVDADGMGEDSVAYEVRGSQTAGALNALRKKAGETIINGDPAATVTEPTGILKAAEILSQQGELVRRGLGYDPQPMTDAETIAATMAPSETAALKLAIPSALSSGYGREIEPENSEIDLGLAELDAQKNAVTRSHYIRMGTLAGLSKNETLLSTPGEIGDLWELYLQAHGVKRSELEDE